MKWKPQHLSEWLAGSSAFGCFASMLSLPSVGWSHVLLPRARLGAVRGGGKPGGRTECCEAGVSKAVLAQRAHGTKLSVSTHQHH